MLLEPGGSYLSIFEASGTLLAADDDAGAGYCALTSAAGLIPGQYFVEVKHSPVVSTQNPFAYTLELRLTLCGNGAIEDGEQCDGGLGCAADCTLLPVCGDGMHTSSETCEDGNMAPGDGCSAACAWESTVEVEPNDSTAQADAALSPISPSANLTGALTPAGENDLFRIQIAANGVLRMELFDATGRDCLVTPDTTNNLTLRLLDSGGAMLFLDGSGSGGIACAARSRRA